MKIMQINAVYPTGSTGKIVKDIHTQLINCGHESIVCYGRGPKVREKNVYKIVPEFIMKTQSLRSKITGYAYAGCLLSTSSLINIIKKEKPDIVHIHCINAYMVNIYRFFEYLKFNNINTVLTLHAEFMYTAGCGYALDCEKWKKGCGNCPQKGKGRPSSKIFDKSAEEWKLMKKAFEGFDNIVITSVSKWLHDRAKQSPFFTDKKMQVVLNGIDTKNVFRPTDFTQLREKYNITNEKIILHVTASFNNPIKGGKYVIELAKKLKNRNIKVIIVGFNGDKNILPSNIIQVPNTKDQKELAAFYTMADLTLLTSVKETFSMICAESLSCGTPVVGFEAGAPETISLNEYSEFVSQGDIDALKEVVEKWIDSNSNNRNDISQVARRYYSRHKMASLYMGIYEEFINGVY